MWETSLLQNWPLQIRLVWSETSGFWVFSDAFCAGCRGIRGVVGLWPVCLRRVVHGRRVGEGTAWGQWGRVRVFLDAGLETETAPRRAPALGSRFRGNDGGGGCGDARGLVVACRRPAHLWIPAFAGTTMAGVGSSRAGDGPAPGPCPGFPLSRERRWEGECAGRAGAVGGGGPFDRLRANGISKRACDVGWWGRAAARRTSGYRLSPVRRWGGPVWEVPWVPARGGGAPRRAPALGSRFRENDGGRGERRWESAGRAGAVGGGGPFDRLRANGNAKRACDVGWWGRAAARRTSGYRLSPVRRWRVWEVGEAETAPPRPCPAPKARWVPAGFRGNFAGRLERGRPACRGSRLRGNDDTARRRGLRRRPCLWRCRL